MSKVESFYWNKLSNKSFSFELEQFWICDFLAVQGSLKETEYKSLPYCKTKGIFQES